MNKYFLSLVVIIICLFGLFTSPVSLFADSRGYDDAEQIRRAGERLDEIDRNQKEQASQRYDARNRSSSSGSGSDALGIIVVSFILLLLGYWIYTANKSQQKKIENDEIQENIRKRDLSKATALGFKIDDSSKICPACAETIKLKAEICKHCKKSFSKDEIQKDIDSALNNFFQINRKNDLLKNEKETLQYKLKQNDDFCYYCGANNPKKLPNCPECGKKL